MKRNFLFAFLVITATIHIQAQIGEKQLPALKDSILKYYQTDKNTGDPVNEFVFTFDLFFNTANRQLNAALKEEGLKSKLSYRELVTTFYDSLYYYFINVALPKEINTAEQNVIKYAALTTEYYCNCLKQQVAGDVKDEEFSSVIQQCTNIMANDNAFMQKVAQVVALNILADKNAVMKTGGISLVAGCKPVTGYFYRNIKNIYIENYILEGENDVLKIADLVNASSPEEKKKLPEVFPAYKKFTNDITKINGLINIEGAEDTKKVKDNKDGTVTIVKTYYRNKQKQVSLLGQAEYVLNKRAPFAIVLSCKYIAPEKIKNAEEVINSIKDIDFILPPPTMEDLREIRIDTKKEGN